MRAYLKVVIASTLLAGVSVTPAMAVTTVSSSAYGISVNLQLASLAAVGIGPIAGVGGSTTGPSYSFDGTVASLTAQNYTLGTVGIPPLNIVTISSILNIGTGLLETSAIGGPLPASQTAGATASVNNLALSLSTLTSLGVGLPILSLGADTLTSSADVNGTPNAFGDASINGLTLSIAGVPITIGANAFVNAAPNTDLLGFLNLNAISGLSIIVNEQIETSGPGTAGITVNALHLIFNDFLIGTRLLKGDIVISHSEALISDAVAVPEPATWLQMIAGFVAVGWMARRSRRRVAAV